LDRLEGLGEKVGKEKLIVDISCRRREDGWVVDVDGYVGYARYVPFPSHPIIAQLPSSIKSNSFIGFKSYARTRIEG
jgi:hypothetical protein